MESIMVLGSNPQEICWRAVFEESMSTRVRINPLVRVRPAHDLDPPSLVLEVPQTRSQLRVQDHRFCTALARVRQCTPRTDVAEYVREELGLPRELAESLTETLLDHQVLLPADADLPFSSAVDDHTLRYHLWIHDYPFVDMSDKDEAVENDRERMAAYEETEPVPDVCRHYPTSRLVDLPEPTNDGFDLPVGEVLFESGEGGDADALSVATLSDVLFYVFGQIGIQEFPVQGDFLIKTSPSGGSRHPTECYVVCRDVLGVPDGIYHYSVRSHALETVRSEIPPAVESQPGNEAPVTLVLASVVERNMWRYREPRTYRVLLHDVGHLVQTLGYVSTAHERLSSATRLTPMQPNRIEEALALDQLVEPVITTVALK
jgi:SagB-type dehydrogenase family enzyme